MFCMFFAKILNRDLRKPISRNMDRELQTEIYLQDISFSLRSHLSWDLGLPIKLAGVPSLW